MPGVSTASRSARPPGADWQDSYFTLEARYHQLRKSLNEKEGELKLLRVAQRKSLAASAGLTKRTPNALDLQDRGTSAAPAPQCSPKVLSALGNGAGTRTGEADVSASSPSYPGPPSAPSIVKTDFTPVSASKLPDPAMIWGSESNVNNYIIASALYHANEELQGKLNESSAVVQSLQRELSSSRLLCTNFQARIEDLAQQMHQLVRERDLSSQKLVMSHQSVQTLERTLQNHIGEEEKLRFSLESQLAELRNRLIVEANSNELLGKEVRSLLSDTKAKEQQVACLRSKLTFAESALSSQRNTNENLLLELRNLNQQLIGERKRLLVTVREVEQAQLIKEQMESLEAQLRRQTEERSGIEREHANLLSEYAHATENALQLARQEMQANLEDWRRAAHHWESVAQLLYKDIAERTQNHQRCRAECDEAKAQRDTLSVELRWAKEELRLCNAKLAIVWPSHTADTGGLSAEEVLDTFKQRVFFAPEKSSGDPEAATQIASGIAAAAPQGHVSDLSSLKKELPADPTTAGDQIHELHEANAALLAEVEQLRLTNEMYMERIGALTGQHKREKQQLAETTREVELREVAGRTLLAQQLDRVQFLEAQVRSLRGYHVSPNMTIESIPASETVLELFLGQIVASHVPEGTPVPENFSQTFCSVDFLLHETVTTTTVYGFNGFFDTTISFRIAMDALLLYYLQTRQLLVQLHRIRSDDEVSSFLATQDFKEQRALKNKGEEMTRCHSNGACGDDDGLKAVESLFETVAEGHASLIRLIAEEDNLYAPRPELKGHVKLVRSNGEHAASVEFFLTARAPFSDAFRELVKETFATAEGEAHPQLPAGSHGQMGSLDVIALHPSSGIDHPAQHTAGGAAAASRQWQRNSTIQSIHEPRQRVEDGGRPSPPRRREEAMQLIPVDARRGVATVRSSLASTRSSGASTGRSSALRDPFMRHRGHEDEIIRMHLPRSSPGTAAQSDPSLTPSVEAAPPHPVESLGSPPLYHSGDRTGFVHIPKNLLSILPSMTRHTPSPERGIHSVVVDVVRLELPTNLPMPIPRLSCLYIVPALNQEVRLPAPAHPQYTVEYPHHTGASFGNVLVISSLAQLARLAREPLTFFFIDEDADPSSGVWAMALCEWTEALERPETLQTYTLPLMRLESGYRGNSVKTELKDAVVRVNITSFTDATPFPSMPERRVVPHACKEGVLGPLSPLPLAAASTSRHEDGGRLPADTRVGVTPLSLQPPSALTALQNLLNYQKEQAQAPPERRVPALSFPGTLSSASRVGAGGDGNPNPQHSIDEELIRLEYRKHLDRR